MSGFGPGTANLFRKMVGLSELSWADQQHLQKILQIRQQRESDQQISKSKIPSKKYTKKRQSSLTEFIRIETEESSMTNSNIINLDFY